MGNRGKLHDDQGRIVRNAETKRWIACLLEFGEVRRSIFSDSYSELFFLDEATAFSAGHRPCAQCQRGRYNAFREAWATGNGLSGQLGADDIDAALRSEATEGPHFRKVGELPLGTFFCIQETAFAVCPQGPRKWSFFGYEMAADVQGNLPVRLLTPVSIVNAFRAGFTPLLHRSARTE
ncbi:hypothetical protein [Ramlibacter sp.]|uniref:hypothetical protein n=1 Tax=Ramlibacter sp. TaxID=1917967 RepID=UPI002D6EEC99|nr:hypothetical protein [Ramlibacter sp.]HYD77538.1 hypothetical protein [Ramlibacter sp.]